MTFKRVVALAMFVGTLTLGASSASAASIVYTFNISNGFGGAGSAPFGTVTLTQNVANVVDVSVSLNNGLRFVTAFDLTFGFNLAGISAVTFSNVPAGWTTDADGTTTNQIDGMGSYEFGLNAPGNGGNNPINGPLNFTVTATGLTLASFNELSSTPGTQSYFVADVIGTGAGAGTGAIGVTGPGVPCTSPTQPGCDLDIPNVPEPATLLLLGSGLAALAVRMRKARA